MTNVVDFQAVDNLKVMVVLLSVFDDILMRTNNKGERERERERVSERDNMHKLVGEKNL